MGNDRKVITNLIFLLLIGAVREDRTPDLTLTKGVLYH